MCVSGTTHAGLEPDLFLVGLLSAHVIFHFSVLSPQHRGHLWVSSVQPHAHRCSGYFQKCFVFVVAPCSLCLLMLLFPVYRVCFGVSGVFGREPSTAIDTLAPETAPELVGNPGSNCPPTGFILILIVIQPALTCKQLSPPADFGSGPTRLVDRVAFKARDNATVLYQVLGWRIEAPVPPPCGTKPRGGCPCLHIGACQRARLQRGNMRSAFVVCVSQVSHISFLAKNCVFLCIFSVYLVLMYIWCFKKFLQEFSQKSCIFRPQVVGIILGHFQLCWGLSFLLGHFPPF